MKKIVSVVLVSMVLAVSGVAFGQDAPAVAKCGALDVPAGCVCKDVGSNTLDCAKGVVQVVAPAGGAGKMVVENGGKITVYVPPIKALDAVVQPEKKDTGWAWWEYGIAGAVAVGLGAGTYYVVDSMTTTTVHVRDK